MTKIINEKIDLNENNSSEEAIKTEVKTSFLGRREVIDKATGEVIELEYIEKKVSHDLKRGWRRVYMENFMELLTGLYAQARKIDVIEFILDNLNSENQLTMSQTEVIKRTGVSRPIVVDTYKYLIKNDFMKKRGTVFIVNPKYVCAFGSDRKNANILINFSSDEPSLF